MLDDVVDETTFLLRKKRILKMEDNSTDKISSCQKSLPSNQNSGWNDPPKLVYSAKESVTPVKKILNKRVAFPLNSSPAPLNSAPTETCSLPPSLECTTKLTTMSHASTHQQSVDDDTIVNAEELLKDCVDNLQFVINKYISEQTRADELMKRLEMMKTMWKENKLNPGICNKVFKISQALKNENASVADELHISLMIEHASICNSWIPCIRQLIQKVKENNAPLNNVSQSASYFVPSSF